MLPTVAVVGQKSKVQRVPGSSASLSIYVKFLPKSTGNLYGNLKSLGKMMKSLPGIRSIKVLTVGDRKVSFQGKPVVV